MHRFVSLPLRPLRQEQRSPFPAWACLYVGSLVFVGAGLFWLCTLPSTDPEFSSRWGIGSILCLLGLCCLAPANWLYYTRK